MLVIELIILKINSTMSDFHGIVVYNITKNGNWIILNGIYANNYPIFNSDSKSYDSKYEVNNQIAKRLCNSFDQDSLVGNYSLRYIDSDLVNGQLSILQNDQAYYVEWKSDDKILFEGIGLKSGESYLSVSYIKHKY